MGIQSPLHEPCHLQIQDDRLLGALTAPKLAQSPKPPKKRVSFDGNVRVQVIETENTSTINDSWYVSPTNCQPKRLPARQRTTRRRKLKITVQKVLAQQAMEQQTSGSVNPYVLADVSLTTSTIFAEEARMAALHCALEVEEYLYSCDSSESISEGSDDLEDVLL